MDQTTMIYIIGALAFVSVVGVGFALFSGQSSTATNKRLRQVTHSGEKRSASAEKADRRRNRQVQDNMKSLREREKKRRDDSVGKTIKDRIHQAGFDFSPAAFWIGSAVLGAIVGVAVFVAGQSPAVVAGAAFAAGLGVPRWFLGMAISGRQKKFALQFADAIDVIVRGVKSGLPLIECLRIIGRESPQPLGGEFARVIDNIQMGSSVDAALDRMYKRMPLAEVNFFNIVIVIQQQAGGNLSEALGNLANVLRSRKMLKEKVKALSSEAKASAMIIGALPVAVMGLVYVTTPAYMMELFTHPVGHVILMVGGALMAVGIFVMRSMINFDA